MAVTSAASASCSRSRKRARSACASSARWRSRNPPSLPPSRWATSPSAPMTGLLILLGVLVVIEVLGLPVLVVLYLAERGRVAERLNALTQELARLRSAMAASGAPEPARPAAPMPGAPEKPAAAAPAPARVLAAAADWATAKSASAAAPVPVVARPSLEQRV